MSGASTTDARMGVLLTEARAYWKGAERTDPKWSGVFGTTLLGGIDTGEMHTWVVLTTTGVRFIDTDERWGYHYLCDDEEVNRLRPHGLRDLYDQPGDPDYDRWGFHFTSNSQRLTDTMAAYKRVLLDSAGRFRKKGMGNVAEWLAWKAKNPLKCR